MAPVAFPSTPCLWRCRLTAITLILGAAALRLAYLIADCPLDLAPDEAHYWDWSRRLDWSYYSKGPLVAWLIRASCLLLGDWSVGLVGTEMLAVRLPAIVCGSLLLAGLYVLTQQIYRSESLALAVVALALTVPVIHVGATLMTIDAPFACCWVWALVLAHAAILQGARWAWPAAGLVIGLGILAKYTMMLFVPLLGLFLLQHLGWRPALRHGGFWVLVVVAALCCLPIVVWNVQHDWVTLRHTQGHAGLYGPLIHWTGPAAFLGGQFALLLGHWFLVWAAATWTHRPWREPRTELRFLWWLSAPVLIFFGLFSLKNGGGEPNWPIVAYLAGMVLAAGWLADRLRRASLFQSRLTWSLVGSFSGLGLLASVLVYHSEWLTPVLAQVAGPATPQRPLPLRRWDPTCRLKGWRTLAARVDEVRAQLRAEGIEPVLAAGNWNLPGEVGFYCQGHPDVYCLGPLLGERHSQYDLWRPNPVLDPEDFLGRTFLLIGIHEGTARQWFDRVEPSQEVVHEDQSHPVASWTITVARGYRGGDSTERRRKY